MKQIINKALFSLVILLGLGLLHSCSYNEILDRTYPAQMIYLPSALSGVYQVADTTGLSGTYRYELDLENNKILIPFGVYRSGVYNEGSIDVDLTINNDTIAKLNDLEQLETPGVEPLMVIDDDKIEFPGTVTIPDGAGNVAFKLAIDLDYIAALPNKRLALAFGITSEQVEVNPDFELTVLELNTNFLVPVADFNIEVDKKDDRKVILTNLSTYTKECVWDFGDGTIRSTLNDTIHHIYTGYQNYPISLKVTGITQKPVTKALDFRVWENITDQFLKNSGNPFTRSDNGTGVVGNLADWTVTDNLKYKGVGGFIRDMKIEGEIYRGLMDFFSTDALLDGKIYQTITLPAGSYRMSTLPILFTGENDCYFAVAEGTEMPNAADIGGSKVLARYFFDAMPSAVPELQFTLTEQTEVTVGFVLNNEKAPKGVFNEIAIISVGLYK